VLTVLIMLAASAAAAAVTYLVLRHSSLFAPSDPAHRAADRVAASPASSFLRRRMDPGTATGLALTVALATIVLGGVVLGAVLLMVRSNTGLARFDRGVAVWGAREAGAFATTILRAVTWLGSTIGVCIVAVVVSVVVFVRTRRAAVFAYLILVVAGQNAAANLVKFLVDRARPAIDQLVDVSGSSFPSGHSTAAAACYAAFALVLGIGLAPRARAALFAVAVAIAVAVGCSRIFLGVHWLTDVIAGFALGWTWFAIMSIAFGGRLLAFGAPARSPSHRSRSPVTAASHPSN
jgi:membrane-associated phospholipid phosphatase